MAQIHLLVGSTLGAAEYLADHLADCLNAAGHQTRIHNPASLAELGDTAGQLLLAVTATHGAGEIPDNLKPRITSYNVCYTKLLRVSWLQTNTMAVQGATPSKIMPAMYCSAL